MERRSAIAKSHLDRYLSSKFISPAEHAGRFTEFLGGNGISLEVTAFVYGLDSLPETASLAVGMATLGKTLMRVFPLTIPITIVDITGQLKPMYLVRRLPA